MSDEDETLASDEVYCTSCGEAIKEEAEICPNCGVENKAAKDKSSYESSPAVSESTGRFISWVLGAFFLLGGLTMLAESPESVLSGIAFSLIGAFLIPPIRNKFEDETDYEFSRGAVLGIVLAGLFVAGSLGPEDISTGEPTSADTGLNSQNSELTEPSINNPSMPSGDPTETVDAYYSSLFGTFPDYERAAEQIKPDVDTTSREFNEFKTYWENQRNMNRPGITAELGYTELVNKNSTNATVRVGVNLESDGFNYDTEVFTVDLRASNGEWLMSGSENPYPAGS
jgi:predicted RNA-binding Zn-ribbon protein involved in translation (DUF1610 family)